MKIGEMVWFPCDFEGYEMVCGLLVGMHDNPSDVEARTFKHVPEYCKDRPRQVADILYKGKMCTAWAHSLRDHDNIHSYRHTDLRSPPFGGSK